MSSSATSSPGKALADAADLGGGLFPQQCAGQSAMARVESMARDAQHVGIPARKYTQAQFMDPEDPQIKQDIIRLIMQFLQDEGYTMSMMTLQDEANVKGLEKASTTTDQKRIKQAILDGEWSTVETLMGKQTFRLRNFKSFQYGVYRQQYLELIERQEYQKAYTYLMRRLKPLEALHCTENSNDIKELCYLLTCKNVADVDRNWEGTSSAREKLVDTLEAMIEFEAIGDSATPTLELPPHRLSKLLQQAVAYQVESSRYRPKTCPNVKTLLEDYSCFAIPNSIRHHMRGHTDNIKCVSFVGEEGLMLATGSSDHTVRLWRTEDASPLHTLTGHKSRVWEISSPSSGALLASASADATIKIWDLKAEVPACVATLEGHHADVYSVQFHPGTDHLISASYDKSIRLWDVRTGTCLKTFSGHTSGVCTAAFNPYGNLVVSGSKDRSIKFWDIVSGLCINTYNSHLGEVTSVEMSSTGTTLLSSSKDNCNRLWDIRNSKVKCRFKGHQNTSKNLIRAHFGPEHGLVMGGSEDGQLFMWDIESGAIVQKLGGHGGHAVYTAAWNSHQSLLASCCNDGLGRTWWYDDKLPILYEHDT